jgi:hypothetical protein
MMQNMGYCTIFIGLAVISLKQLGYICIKQPLFLPDDLHICHCIITRLF